MWAVALFWARANPNTLRLAVAVLAIGAVLGAVWLNGRHAGDAAHQVEISHDQAGAARANGKTATAVATATDAHAATTITIAREANDARRQIEHAPSAVERPRLVYPALGRIVLCRVERLRNPGADRPACDEPAPSGDPAHRLDQ